jgi:heptosyltransferase-2
MQSSATYHSPNIRSKPWRSDKLPQRILAIRLHALGDVVITLPYMQYLKKNLPGLTLDLLIREETDEIPKSLLLFDHVYSIGGGRNYKKQLLYSTILLPQLYANRYDIVIDLQNNIVSKFFRKALMPKAWSEFDRFSPIAAGLRTKNTIEAIGLGKCFAESSFVQKNNTEAIEVLQRHGWKTDHDLVILNPAGAFETRNWPIDNYSSFAKIWLEQFPKTQFIIMGIGTMVAKANYLKEQLGEHLMNIVNSTSPSQAFSIVQEAKFILSEDSGLMHMAWVSGIPTLALFGSTRSDWARPLGEHTIFFDSSDLTCGNCMKEICMYGNNKCMTRYKPEEVFEKAIALMNKVKEKKLSQLNIPASAK